MAAGSIINYWVKQGRGSEEGFYLTGGGGGV